MLLWTELQGLVSLQLEKLIKPVRDASDNLQGSLERIGSMMERAVAALEGLSLAPACLQTSPVQMALASASSSSPSLADGGVAASPNQLELVVDTCVPLAVEEMMEFGSPCSKENVVKEITKVDAPQEPVVELVVPVVELVVPSALDKLKDVGAPGTEKSAAKEPLESWGEFIEELALSLSGSPQILQVREAAPSHIERRSCRLDKKSKERNIHVAKCVEYRQAESFGGLHSRTKGKPPRMS